MPNPYAIMYTPLTFELMGFIGKDVTVTDLLTYLSGKDAHDITRENYLEYLAFDPVKERIGLPELIGFDNYSSYYVANQIAGADSRIRVIIADGKRRKINEIIQKMGQKPMAVFITSISSTFPTTVALTLALNHARIPVVIGGIHVSCSPGDVDIFIRKHLLHPALVSQVRGPGDRQVMGRVMKDLKNINLQAEYFGAIPVENGVWGNPRVESLPDIPLDFLKGLPICGNYLSREARLQVTTPYMGCPYSCSFCSISALRGSQKRFTMRTPEDFVDEILSHQRTGHVLKSRFYIFLPDNMLLGGKNLEALLDYMIQKKVKINYGVQISIEVADNQRILEKLRLSGASFLFVGFESLDIRDLELMDKHAAKLIRKSGLSVEAYYAQKIKILQRHGFVVHGAFIFGLPFNYFNSLNDHSGTKVTNFCNKNKIGIQATCLNDLPGSRNFTDSQAKGTFIYGQSGTMDYLFSLCSSDLIETNRPMPETLYSSPLLATYMAYVATQRAGRFNKILKTAILSGVMAWKSPTINGRTSLKQRLLDVLCAVCPLLTAKVYKAQIEGVVLSRNGRKGLFERLYAREKDPFVLRTFKSFIGEQIRSHRP
ncbi:hypothetical protein [Desulfobacula sp.]|uniref:B12-binding domain-containing radical SAM protein n=1 Tax=Desulfobacula sp. TaxID=2593537 RepID=UPI002604337B|nr:hypothetical protein [Desulfobacula sp.]